MNINSVIRTFGSKIGVVEKKLPEFNKGGARLVSSKKGVAVPFYDLKNIKNGAKTVDTVFVESDFGKKSTKIVSYKDDDGNLIKRVRTTYDKDSKTTSKMVGEYNLNDYVTVNRNYYNGKNLQKTEKFEMVPYGNYNRSKDTTEIQDDIKKHNHIELYGVGKDANYIEIGCTSGADGKIVDGKIDSNCLTGSEKYKLNRLSYLYKFNLKGKDFFNAILPDIIKSNNFKTSKPKIKFVKKLPPNVDGATKLDKVFIEERKLYNNSSLVNVLNHELKHCKQNELFLIKLTQNIMKKMGASDKKIQELINKNSLNGKPIQLSKNKQKAADKYYDAIKSYKKDKKKGYDGYRNNLLEQEAFKVGDAAENEYHRQYDIYRNIVSSALTRK